MNRHAHTCVREPRMPVRNLGTGRVGLWLLAFAMALTGGCSRSEEGAERGGRGAATRTAATRSPRGASGLNRVIALISPEKTSPFQLALTEAAAEEAQRQGLPDLISVAPDRENDAAGQIAVAQEVIRQHPAAISLCSATPEALSTIVQKANEADIPIFVHDPIRPRGEPGTVIAYIGYDETRNGRQCGKAAAELLKRKNGDYRGAVALLVDEPGDRCAARMDGFKEGLLDGHPNIRVVGEQNARGLRDLGASITRDWLQRYPMLDLVFGCNDAMAQGAAQAAKLAGHPLLTVGIDGNKSALEDVKAGNYTASLATQPARMGEMVTDTVLGYLNRKQTPQVVETPTVIVTRQNVDHYLK